jgi:hypothetical protein
MEVITFQTPQNPTRITTSRSCQANTIINCFNPRPHSNTSNHHKPENMRPDGPRDPIVGPDSGPAPPFPLKLNGEVVKGFGRGSKEVSTTFSHVHQTQHFRYISSDAKQKDAKTKYEYTEQETLTTQPARHSHSQHPPHRPHSRRPRHHRIRRLLRLLLPLFHQQSLPPSHVHRLEPLLQKHSPQRRSPRARKL